LVDVGEYRLKDLDRPVRLFQLAAAGLDAPSRRGRGGWLPGTRAARVRRAGRRWCTGRRRR
jgi:hypothetical protein